MTLGRYLLLTLLFLSMLGFVADAQRQYALGCELTYKENEYVPALFGHFPLGLFALEAPYLSITILPRDPYNSDKINVSGSGVLSIAGIVIGANLFAHPDSSTLGRNAFLSSFTRVLGATIMFPLMLANSQHHLNIPTGSNFQPSIFLTSRTDLFMLTNHHWVRYSPGIGFELFFKSDGVLNTDEDVSSLQTQGYGLQFGMERQFDFVDSRTLDKDWRVFVGLKYRAN